MSGILKPESGNEFNDSDSDSDEEGLSFSVDSKRNETGQKSIIRNRSKIKEFVVATPAEFVTKFGGNKVIEKVFVANNGIAAVKCIRSMRQWAYDLFGNEKVIKFVVMTTPEDLKANAEYIKMADHYVMAPGGANNNNYANVELIVDMAKRIPVQAVWAGWGHASENPRLPELLQNENIAFIGPSSHSMWSLGDKVASTITAQTLNIPTLPWSGSGIVLGDEDIIDGKLQAVPPELFQRACVDDAVKGLVIAREIGYPIMIKASEGGGGKGIRKVYSDEAFSIAFRQVEAEVPGSPIFLMKCLERARHLEVQILADQYGNVVSLFGRDCSVQRRHQKIIEEGPVAICKSSVFIEMEKDAVKLAKSVGYASAGTVEYLYDYVTKQVYFLELNPRLQVEHPCTEMITDINLPAAQLQIAMGVPLNRIKDIRLLYGEDPWESNIIPFGSYHGKLTPKGHVIAARITAENPDEGFKPSSGTIRELSFRSNNHNWGYFSVTAEGSLHEYADSQFGHLFAWGEDREAARKNMVLALKELSIRGDFRTTVEYLVRLLETDQFRRNKIDTAWLDNLIAEKMKAESPDLIPAVICGALHVADDVIEKSFAQYEAALERGQVPKGESVSNIENVELIHENNKYILQVTKSGPTQYFLEMNRSVLEVDVHRMSDGGLMVSIGDTTYTSFLKEEVDGYRVVVNGKTCMFKKENDPSILRSPSPGKLINFTVEDGGHVFQGEAYAEIEVMKMVMPLIANVSGCVHYVKCAGTILEPGMIIARLSLDDPSHVFKAQPYLLPFPDIASRKTKSRKLHHVCQFSRNNLVHIMNGYKVPKYYFEERIDDDIKTMIKALADPALPLLEMQELLASVSGRIPQLVEDAIKGYLNKYSSNITSILNQFPTQQIANVVDHYAATLTKRSDRDVFFMNTQGIVQLVQRFRNGIKGYRKSVILNILRQYLQVELLFNEGNFEKCVAGMLHRYKDVGKVTQYVFSHTNIAQRNALVIKLLDHLSVRDAGLSDEVRNLLQEVTHLNRQEHGKVALKSRQILISSQRPSFELRHNQYESIFLSAIDLYGQQVNPENLQKIILSETSVFDLIPTFFYHRNELVRMAALEVYIRRSYQAYELTQVQHDQVNDVNIIMFTFKLPSNHPNRKNEISNPAKKKSGNFDKFVKRINRVNSIPDSIEDMGKDVHLCDERMGAMLAFDNVDDFLENFDEILKRFSISELLTENIISGKISSYKRSSSASLNGDEDPIHIINICIKQPTSTMERQEEEIEQFQNIMNKWRSQLHEHGIRRISILVTNMRGEFPHYYTFRARDQFKEDLTYRHLEPALAFQLELNRMRLFDLKPIPCTNKSLHIYYGSAKKERASQDITDYRFFIRSIVRHSDFVTKDASFDYLEKASEIQLLEALDELEVALSKVNRRTDCNHVFLNFVPTVIIEPQKIEESIRKIVLRHGLRLWRLRVLQAECKMVVRLHPDGPRLPLRLFLSNQSGYSLDIHTYQEIQDPSTGKTIFQSYGTRQGPQHGLQVNTPYVTKDHLQYKRFAAQSQNTTYVYDFPDLFKQSVTQLWKQSGFQLDPNKSVLTYTELRLDHNKKLQQINRLPGENECGMVAWLFTLFTPEYPDGRTIYICVNDITYMIGSFSISEDYLYDEVLKKSMEDQVPFVYISANSGARIGLAEEIKHLFKVEWCDENKPDKGFKYLYLAPSDFKRLSATNSIRAEPVEKDGECYYRITDIIGKETGIGVENLKGSGLIAGRTSEAYENIVTISMVTCRTVGIGSYLTRLSQRIIQVDNSCIILTGCQALNKLLGRQVYASHHQLGGTQIMYKNGVSHLVVDDDISGVYQIVKWLSYVPKKKGAPLPVMASMDPIDRDITFTPTKATFNPRHMITGRENPHEPNIWETGLFDKNSFTETLGGWARTVICGRARLGGIPLGVIFPELQPVEVVVPPDPADPTSETKTFVQAGQVWYPDSSFKTAQAIRDFNHEELPLIIIANWRGFSGGMKDMFDQVLKFGSYIVDALRDYKQPVLSYIPPHGELRGGAWVVVDPSINNEYMEMYADEEARGGVLEPSGTCEVKFKHKDLIKAMKRLDETYSQLHQQITSPDVSLEEKRKLEKQISSREKQLLPVYHQIALTYADLHDTAIRMQEKGVVNGILKWKTSRKFLYWRLKRLLLLDRIVRMMKIKDSKCTKAQADSVIQRLFLEKNGSVQSYLWEDNEFVANWIESDLSQADENSVIKEHVKWHKRDALLREIKNIVDLNPDIAMDAIVHITQQITSAKRNELSRVLHALNSQCDNEAEEEVETKASRALSLPP